MNYQAIGHLLFPIWVCGCLIACACNSLNFKTLLLSMFYMFVPVLMFQFQFDGAAKSLKWEWYLLVSGTEIFIILLALGSEVRATKPLIVLALISMLINLIYLPFYLSGNPLPRQAYFVTVSGIQALQIGSLIVFAPLWPFLSGLVRKNKRRESPWMHRTTVSGQL